MLQSSRRRRHFVETQSTANAPANEPWTPAQIHAGLVETLTSVRPALDIVD
jgi:hypothetical protein